jgi:hypothetical protein
MFGVPKYTVNIVRHGDRYLPPCGLAADVYFSNFLVRPFIFRKSKKKKYKKIQGFAVVVKDHHPIVSCQF